MNWETLKEIHEEKNIPFETIIHAELAYGSEKEEKEKEIVSTNSYDDRHNTISKANSNESALKQLLFEKYYIEIEKIKTKLEDSNEKLTKMYDMLKSIGGMENLVDINKNLQEKLKEVEEAIKYIGRIAEKPEKEFMELSRDIHNLNLFKAEQEELNKSIKEITKSIDSLNVKFEDCASKKYLDFFKEDILTIKKQLKNINEVLSLEDDAKINLIKALRIKKSSIC